MTHLERIDSERAGQGGFSAANQAMAGRRHKQS